MWFDGPIADAVAKTKADKTLLIVFVYGTDERSTTMKENWENENIRKICDEKNCVALKLEDKSAAAKQFAAIYPLLCVPCLYFIGTNGRTLEIVAELSAEILEEKLKKCLELHEASKSSTEMPSTSKVSGSNSISNRKSPEKTLEEKVALAQELIKIKREEKLRKEEEDAKANELKRRQEGKGVNEARERLKEQEIVAAAEERRNDKKADKAHLQKLREQIAADRAEKNQSFVAQKTEEEAKKIHRKTAEIEEEQEKARLDQLERCKFARIQFRLPDGSASKSQNFEAEQPFLDAIQVAEGIVNLSSTQFRLVQMLPRREFTAEDLDKSFKELELVPSAVLMILPNWKLRTQQVGWLQWAMSFVPSSIRNWVYSFFLSTPKPIVEPNSSSTGSKTFGNQQGNIRRMPGTGGDSRNPDDNATWNGNSTQQL